MTKSLGSVNTTCPIRSDDHSAGSDTAAITLVAYCDFQCPYCRHASPIMKRLQDRLGDRLRLVFRHFPLIQKHLLAQQAAEASEAADAQGQFWAMHDLLFEHQRTLEKDDLCRYAEILQLDLVRFERDVTGRMYAKRVERDHEGGRLIGVEGTPTFYLNGVVHTDEDTLEEFVLRLNDSTSV